MLSCSVSSCLSVCLSVCLSAVVRGQGYKFYDKLYLPCYQFGKSPILLLAEEMLEQREHSLMVSLPNELEQMETGPTEQISNQQSLPSGAIHVDTLVSAW